MVEAPSPIRKEEIDKEFVIWRSNGTDGGSLCTCQGREELCREYAKQPSRERSTRLDEADKRRRRRSKRERETSR